MADPARNNRSTRGVVSIALAIAMLAVGAMAGGIFPQETAYVMPLFVFSAAIFMADGAVTFTRMQRNQMELDRERDRASSPWRIAFAVSFLLALVSAARTGPSFVTTTAVVLSVAAATVYLYKRRFFAILKETASMAGSGSSIRQAVKSRDHAAIAAALEERLEAEKDPGRRTTLLLSLGAVQVVRGAYLQAIRAFERIDRKRKEGAIEMSLVIDLNVASAYVAMGDFESAEIAMSRIKESSVPDEFTDAFAMNRSAILVGKGAHAESIKFVDALPLATLSERSRLPFLRDLAESLAASGTDTTRAMDIATQCLSIDNGAQSHNVLACVLIAQKKFEEAKTALAEALRLNNDARANLRVLAETFLYLGLAERGKGDSAAARDLFEKAAKVEGGGRFSRAAVREAAKTAT